MEQICADLAAEHEALDAVVADLDEPAWCTPTAAQGWTVHDTVFHVAFFDDMARLAVVDPEGFERRRDGLLAGDVDSAALAAAMSGAELLAWWRGVRTGLLGALAPLEPKARITWFGPPMSALSFATARLMETWSHGQDVAAALGRTIAPTERLRHIAHLGVVTRGWSYVNRGLAARTDPVRVELQAPTGELWTWGPDDAPDTVMGTALDFCLVVTQRRPVEAVGLVVVGPAATEWMAIAQAFAGPPTITDRHRSPGGDHQRTVAAT